MKTLCKIKLMTSRYQEMFLTTLYLTMAVLLIFLPFCKSSERTSLLLLLWSPDLITVFPTVFPPPFFFFCLFWISGAVHGRKSFIAWKDIKKKKVNKWYSFFWRTVASVSKVKALAWPCSFSFSSNLPGQVSNHISLFVITILFSSYDPWLQ